MFTGLFTYVAAKLLSLSTIACSKLYYCTVPKKLKKSYPNMQLKVVGAQFSLSIMTHTRHTAAIQL